MAAMDRDTFIPLGTSIVKLLLIASGQGALATAVGEGAGLLAKFRRTLEIGGNRAVFAEKIADDAAKQLLREHQGISEADWHVAARQAASLIDRLSEKERLAAGYNWEELRRTLLDLGGTDLRSDLADESARQAFDWVLEVACQRIADCFTEKEALASILESVEEVRAGIQRLADRPVGASQTRTVVADHMEVVRDLAPDPLEDREREIAELTAFVHGAPDAWYAMEAGMISGKTALMSSFTLNPPSDVHIVSFFIRRMGGDGNDWRSFSFVAGAQLAEILGDEYTERVSEPASQNTEFRQLLRRAAAACQSDKNPRPLVLVIDGVDEDSYYEDPDAPGAKSILSLLPRHLPEGVKLVTASRPNPRMPEDIVCNASRVVVSLKPSPIAQEKINQKDIETFFKSDLAVDIGAFLAACGGSLTVDELRQLIARRRHVDNVPSRDVKSCVDHSPGRMLMRVNVGFGDREVPSYTLGHDAVLRAVLRELSPNLFGECSGFEGERMWAQVRNEALGSYREVILKWVADCAGDGWGRGTPIYILSEACFDLMLNSDALLILRPGRYKEVRRRFGWSSQVLRMVDLECFKVLDANCGELPECAMMSILEVSELRYMIPTDSIWLNGLFRLYVWNFGATPDVVLDMVISAGNPNSKMGELGEMAKEAIRFGGGRIFLLNLSAVLDSLASRRDLRDGVLYLLVTVIASFGCVVNESEVDDCKLLDGLEDWINDVIVSARLNEGDLQLYAFDKGVGNLIWGDWVISILRYAEDISELIMEPMWRARALVEVIGVLVRVGETDRVRKAAENTVSAAERIKLPWDRVQVLVAVADGLVRVGLIDEAFAVVQQIEEPLGRAQALSEMAGALAQEGQTNEALAVVGQIEESRERARALSEVARALARVGLIDEGLAVVGQIEEPLGRARALSEMAGALAQEGQTNEALAVVGQIEESRERARALSEVVSALARVGEVDRARRVAETAVSTAEQIEQPRERAQDLSAAVGGLVRAGEPDEALAVAEQIEEPRERAQALLGVARALVWEGSIDKGLAVAEQIEEPLWYASALSGVAGALAQADAVDEVLKILSVMNDPASRSRALDPVITALVRKGSSDEAVETVRAELTWVRGVAQRQHAASCCSTLAATCAAAADLVDETPALREQWLGLARSALARSWLYGASVWDHFDILMRVAPELAVQLVDERILADPEQGTAPESDPDLGPEGPGGNTGSYR